MNAHAQKRAAAALFHIPGIAGVRSGVRLARADDEHLADGPVLHRLPRPQHVGHERLGLGVAVPNAVLAHRVEDGLGLGAVAAQRLGADDGLARLGGGDAGRRVGVVRQTDRDEIDVVTGDGRLHVGRPLGNAPLGRELRGPGLAAREVDHDLLPRHVAQRAHKEVTHEPAANHGDSNHLDGPPLGL